MKDNRDHFQDTQQENLAAYEQRKKQETIIAQRLFRSAQRRSLHLSIFNEEPVTAWPQLKMMPGYYNSDLHYRVETIISELVQKQKIINGNQLYHYTSISNLSSIVNHQYLFGNDYLKKNQIPFNQNAFCEQDIGTGDAKVICFCPGQVDLKAFTYHYQLKKNMCRLSININQKDIPFNKAINNQFFKLSDFWANWSFFFKIDNKVSALIRGISGISIFLFFDGIYEEVCLNKQEMIYYGNIFSINRFCSVQLFNIINKIENEELKNKLYHHLSDLNYDDLRKFLIVFSQNLTLFAEYNFNACLPLEDIKINEVLMIGDKKIKINFMNLDENEYNNALDLLRSQSLIQLEQLHGETVDENNTICKKRDDKSFDIFGKIVGTSSSWPKEDFSSLPSEIFAQDAYIETRPGVIEPQENQTPVNSKICKV